MLALMVATTGLPLLAMALWSGGLARSARVAGAEARLEAVAATATAEILQYMEFSERILAGLAREPAIRSLSPERCGDQLERLRGHLGSLYQSVDLWGEDGRVICAGLAGFKPGLSLLGTGSFDASLAAGGFNVTPAFVERRSGQWSTALTYPVEGLDGGRGFISAVVDMVEFQRILASLELPPEATVTITNTQGQVLARSRSPEAWVGTELGARGTENLRMDEGNPGAGWTRAETLDGTLSDWRFNDVPGTPWRVLVGLPTDLLLGPVWRDSLRFVFAGLLVVVACGVAGMLVHRRISRALRGLVEGVDGVDVASFEPLPETGPAEVAHVARRFNEAWEQILQLQRRVNEGEKMEALGRMAGGIAHDFNNILTVVGGQSDLLRTDPELGEEHLEQAGEIYQAAERGTGLVRQLLDFCRGHEGTPVPVFLHEHLAGIRRLLEHAAGPGVQVVLEAHPVPSLICAPSEIEQIAMNLVVNARDAMEGEGRIVVSTSEREVGADEADLYPYAAAGRHVVLSVADSGPGVPEEIRGHIFEPFYTTKEPGAGTGLGLATVFGIVTRAGGHIRVENDDRGARFEIFLPLSPDGAPSGSGSPGGAPSGPALP
jgi:signal transduction histidine kinase